MKTKDWINQIVAKLYNEGICQSDYSLQECKQILNNCVAPDFCINILIKHEEAIKKLLPF